MNPSTALATVLVDELARHGVREAVLCPGSRSAPLAYALQEADRAGRIRLHVRVDERSAGFLALGLAKLTRRPVPVVTTSGTAVANLHPAVLEAHHAAVPLLVLSADRPPELRGTGANQTTTQPGLFGMPVRWLHDLGAPERRAGQVAVWRSTASRACAAATGALGGTPGPVHLNLPLREPLVPTVDAEPWPEPLDGRPGGAPWVRTDRAIAVAEPLEDEPRTLVLLGDLPDPSAAAAVASLVEATGWPLLAEPFGALDRATVTPHGPLLLTATGWLEQHLPARVLDVGRNTLARAVAALLRRPEVRVEVITPAHGWPDPGHVAARVHPWAAITGHEHLSVDRDWAGAWHEAGRTVAAAAQPVIAGAWPSGLGVAATVAGALPEHATLFVGSSNAARDLDLALTPTTLATGAAVVASRGLAGIDGCVSTSVGLALAHPGRPTYALMGDLTFLHDSNGLLIGPHEPRPDLTVVVPNDDGGGIFTLLEPGEPARAADFERIFGTPTGTSLADLCRAHGVDHASATTREELTAAVAARPAGLRVVEIPLPRDGHRDLHARLREAAATALA
ncbi:MAG: 2-succinyl-5-enolpyruvyl-6-hydroxy-3-cyclohexene-1-carboxylic-acid synthase [Oryzihumus sp.]